MMIALSAAAASSACSPRFGKLPDGKRLERITKSPHYADGAFHNLEPTETLEKGSGRLSLLRDFFFKKWERRTPSTALPIIHTNLNAFTRQTDLVVWLGHSSLYAQLGGKRILIDPVFASSAAPFSGLNKAFMGHYPYSAESVPDIDYLIISHDHWDHLEYPTMIALQSRVKTVICPLGVGSHLEYWGFNPGSILEGDWGDTFHPEPGFTVAILPARHFSGRWIRNNKTLWASFMLETPGRRVFYSGDSGYGKHFADIGEHFGSVDLAIMESGQYNRQWRNIHMMPEETARAAVDVRARAVLPVHSGRFSLAYHAWDESYVRLAAASSDAPFRLLTPLMGEVVYLDDSAQTFTHWWESVEDSPQTTDAANLP